MSKLKPTTGPVNIGELFVCNCGIPLAKRTGIREYELVKIHNKERVPIKIEIGDMVKISCEICGRGFAFLRIVENISVNDSVKVDSKNA